MFRKIVIIIFSILISINLIGCAGKKSKTKSISTVKESSVAGMMVKTIIAESSSIEEIIKSTGTIEAQTSVKLSSKIGGKIKRVYRDKGEYVTKGSVLIKLEDKELRAQRAQARAAYRAALAQLEKIKRGARYQEKQQTEATVAQAKANKDIAKKNLERMESLYKEGIVSQQALDQAKTAHQIAQSQYKQALETKSLIYEGAREEDISAIEAQVEQARATISLVNTQLQNTIIRSPISGKIAEKFVERGEVIGPGMPLFLILDIKKVKVKIGVNEKKIKDVKIGQRGRIEVSAYSNRVFYGKVTYISTAANPMNKLFNVEIEIENPGGLLKPGMFAKCEIITRIKEKVVVLPKRAVLDKEGKRVVFINKEGLAREREVTIGIESKGNIEIVSGIIPGEEVIIEGNYELEDGIKVSKEE